MTGASHGRAVVLLSGGLDSTTVLALAHAAGREVFALSFNYGQRHEVELACARRQAQRYAVQAHEVVDLGHVGALVKAATSLVAGSELAVPKDAPSGEIPSTYVPGRNTLFLAYALAWAEALAAREIWLGINALDYSGYPDCRPEFVHAFQEVADRATKAGVEGHRIHLHTPLLHWTKAQIVEAGVGLGVDYADTLSCYDPSESRACGRCDSCQLRRRGFAEAGVADPTLYV